MFAASEIVKNAAWIFIIFSRFAIIRVCTGQVIVGTHGNASENFRYGRQYIPKFSAYDQEGSTYCIDCTFTIYPISNPDGAFCIGKKNGNIKVFKPLDREKRSFYKLDVKILHPGGNISKSYLAVDVLPENDNAPFINFSSPVILTNGSLNSTNFPLFDRDSDDGNQLVASIHSNFTGRFSLNCEAARGKPHRVCNITSLEAVDRRPDGTTIQLPINVSDGRNTAIRYIPVHFIGSNGIHDANCSFEVYCYKSDTDTIDVGRVYVEGLDTSKKNYTFNVSHKQPELFNVISNGILSINLSVAQSENEEYSLEVKVTDDQSNVNATAVSHIKVQILRISDRVIRNAGSIRLQNVEPEDFISIRPDGRSQYEALRKFLAETFNVPWGNVMVFSIMSENRFPAIIQIYFTVGERHKQLKPTFLNGVVSMNRFELEKALGSIQGKGGAKVLQAGVNDCVFEGCNDGCENIITATGLRKTYSADNRSLACISINVSTLDRCHRHLIPFICSPSPCHNRGLCHEADTGIFCECRSGGMGPQCQGRMRTFNGPGSSYVWLDPIKPCDHMRIHFYFMTFQHSSMLLFNGPMAQDADNYYLTSDFIAVYITNKMAALQVNFSGKNYSLHSTKDVSDGQWHKVDIIVNQKNVTLLVDNKHEGQKVVNVSTQLKVNDPLQVGGLATNGHQQYGSIVQHFADMPHLNGCIRDLHINDVMQDLSNPAYSNRSEAGCSKVLTQCMREGRPCCMHGLCNASLTHARPRCICDTGYGGDCCDKKAQWRHFKSESYVKYKFGQTVQQETAMDVQMLVAPDCQSGTLISAGANSRQMQIKLNNSHLVHTTMTNGSGTLPNEKLVLSGIQLNSSSPYLVRLKRDSNSVELSLDHGQAPYKVSTYGDNSVKLDLDQIYAGAESNVFKDDFKGCVAQISYNSHLLPLPYDEFQSSANIILSDNSSVARYCPNIRTCATANLDCKQYYVCRDFWKGPFCTCEDNAVPVFNETDWVGCQPAADLVATVSISNWALAVILVCCLLFVLIVLLIMYTRRQRRRYAFLPHPLGDQKESVSKDDLEGAGEWDNEMFDRRPLQVPVYKADKPSPSHHDKHDERRPYEVEAPGEPTGRLSPLPSESESSDLSRIEEWGPKFAHLANIR